MLREHSPLEDGLPGHLPRKQILFFDAIALSLRALDRSYGVLRPTLAAMTIIDGQPLIADPRTLTDRRLDALASAWAMVDALHRLGALVRQMPGLKQRSAGVGAFLRATASVEDLRHAMQHLDRHIDEIAESGCPVWGSLTWAAVLSERQVSLNWYVPGHIAKHAMPAARVPTGAVASPIDMVNLTAAGRTVDLTGLHAAAATFATRLERAADVSFDELRVLAEDAGIVVPVQLRVEV